MPERGDAVANCSRLGLLMSLWGVLEGVARLLMRSQMILIPLLLGYSMGMCGEVV